MYLSTKHLINFGILKDHNSTKFFYLLQLQVYLREVDGNHNTSPIPASLLTSLAAANKKSLTLFTYTINGVPTGSLWLKWIISRSDLRQIVLAK